MEGSSHHQRTEKVVDGITTQLANGYLASGDDHSLVQVFKHEAQGARCICHGIGTMYYDEAIVVTVILLNDICHVNLIDNVDTR